MADPQQRARPTARNQENTGTSSPAVRVRPQAQRDRSLTDSPVATRPAMAAAPEATTLPTVAHHNTGSTTTSVSNMAGRVGTVPATRAL
jgi:hypothetical protein